MVSKFSGNTAVMLHNQNGKSFRKPIIPVVPTTNSDLSLLDSFNEKFDFFPSVNHPQHLEANLPLPGRKSSSDDIPELLKARKWRPPKECLTKGTGVYERIVGLIGELARCYNTPQLGKFSGCNETQKTLQINTKESSQLESTDAPFQTKNVRFDAGDSVVNIAKPDTLPLANKASVTSPAKACLNRLIVELGTSHAEYIWLVEEVEKASCRASNLKFHFNSEFGPNSKSTSKRSVESAQKIAHDSSLKKIHDARQEADELEREVDALRTTVCLVESENNQLLPVQVGLKREFENVQQKLNETVAKRAQQNMHIRDNEVCVMDVNDQLGDLELEFLNLRGESEQILGELRTGIAREEAIRFSAEQEVDTLRRVQREKTQQIQLLQSDAATMGVDVGRFKAKIDDANKVLSRLKYKIDPIEKRYEYQAEQLAVVLEEIRLIQAQKDALETECDERIEKMEAHQLDLRQQFEAETVTEHEMVATKQICSTDYEELEQAVRALREAIASKMRDVTIFRESLALCAEDMNDMLPNIEALCEVKRTYEQRAVEVRRDLGFKQEMYERQVKEITHNVVELTADCTKLEINYKVVNFARRALIVRLAHKRAALRQQFEAQITIVQASRESAGTQVSTMQARADSVHAAFSHRNRRLSSVIELCHESLRLSATKLTEHFAELSANDVHEQYTRQQYKHRQQNRDMWETLLTEKRAELVQIEKLNKKYVEGAASVTSLISQAQITAQHRRKQLLRQRAEMSTTRVDKIHEIYELELQVQFNMWSLQYMRWQNQRITWRIANLVEIGRVMDEKAARRQVMMGRVKELAMQVAGHTMGWRTVSQQTLDTNMLNAAAQRSVRVLCDRAEIYSAAQHLTQRHVALYVIRKQMRRAMRALMHNEAQAATSFYEWQYMLGMSKQFKMPETTQQTGDNNKTQKKSKDYYVWNCWFCEQEEEQESQKRKKQDKSFGVSDSDFSQKVDPGQELSKNLEVNSIVVDLNFNPLERHSARFDEGSCCDGKRFTRKAIAYAKFEGFTLNDDD